MKEFPDQECDQTLGLDSDHGMFFCHDLDKDITAHVLIFIFSSYDLDQD
jgi:hypothetical protein